MRRQFHAAKLAERALVVGNGIAGHEEFEVIVFRLDGDIDVVGLFLPGCLLLALEPAQEQLVGIDEGRDGAEELLQFLRPFSLLLAEEPEELLRAVNRVVFLFDPRVDLLISDADIGQPSRQGRTAQPAFLQLLVKGQLDVVFGGLENKAFEELHLDELFLAEGAVVEDEAVVLQELLDVLLGF